MSGTALTDLSTATAHKVVVHYEMLLPAVVHVADLETNSRAAQFQDVTLAGGYAWAGKKMNLCTASLGDIKASLAAITSIDTPTLESALKSKGVTAMATKDKRRVLACALVAIAASGQSLAFPLLAGIVRMTESLPDPGTGAPPAAPAEPGPPTSLTPANPPETTAIAMSAAPGAQVNSDRTKMVETKRRRLAEVLRTNAERVQADQQASLLAAEEAELDRALSAATEQADRLTKRMRTTTTMPAHEDSTTDVAETPRSKADITELRELRAQLAFARQVQVETLREAGSHPHTTFSPTQVYDVDVGRLTMSSPQMGHQQRPPSKEAADRLFQDAIAARQGAVRNGLRREGVMGDNQLVNANLYMGQTESSIALPAEKYLRAIRKGTLNFPLGPMLQGQGAMHDVTHTTDSGLSFSTSTGFGVESKTMSIKAWAAAVRMLAAALEVITNLPTLREAMLHHISVVEQLAFWYQGPVEKEYWRQYDLAVRTEASVIWSATGGWPDFQLNKKIEESLYRLVARTRCIVCMSTAHFTETCTEAGDATEPAVQPATAAVPPAKPPAGAGAPATGGRSSTVCGAFQKTTGQGCTFSKKNGRVCAFLHVCSKCAGTHPLVDCTAP